MTVFILKVKGAPVAGCVTVVVALVKGSLTHVKYRLVREQHTKTLTNRNQRSRSRIVVAHSGVVRNKYGMIRAHDYDLRSHFHRCVLLA